MRTERQTNSSHADGARSNQDAPRGPVTEQDKANSLNRRKHDLLVGTIVLRGESEERFLHLSTSIFNEFQPQTFFEESLVEIMIAARWRQLRVQGIEKAAMDLEGDKLVADMIRSATPRDAANPNFPEAAACITQAFRTLTDESQLLALINRFDARFERQYLHAHRRFIEVRDRRNPPARTKTLPTPVPAPVPPACPPQSSEAAPENNNEMTKRTRQIIEKNRSQPRLRARTQAARHAFKRIKYRRRKPAASGDQKVPPKRLWPRRFSPGPHDTAQSDFDVAPVKKSA